MVIIGYGWGKATGRLAMHHECANCGGHFPASHVAVDHIDPVVNPNLGFVDWDTMIKRMFCESEGLQVLCKDLCHAAKTSEEKGIAKARRNRES